MKGSIASGKWFLALVLIASGIVNAICFIPVIVNAFCKAKDKANIEMGERVAYMLYPSAILVVAAIFIGLCPGIVWPGVDAVVKWFF